MSEDDRDMLELLSAELSFIEAGGYGRSVRTPWKPTSIFEDSLSCLNYGYPYRAHPCSECILIDLVPEEERGGAVPCHHIPLNETGDTVETLELEGNQQKLEDTTKKWLRAKIKQVEATRAFREQVVQEGD